MALPPSFAKDGFQHISKIRPRYKRLMMSIAGDAGTGKSTFALTAPGPGLGVILDRGIEQSTREDAIVAPQLENWGFQILSPPMPSAAKQEQFASHWVNVRDTIYRAAANVEARSIMFDGDTESWQLQRAAEFGKLTKVPSHLYDGVNSARRAFYARCFDSGKNFIATNTLSKIYVTKLMPDGTPEKNSAGNDVRVWNGEYERKGFSDQTYLWQVHVLALHEVSAGGEHTYGIKIEMNKLNPSVEGMELWGEECNFQTLAQYTYPNSKPEDWGYPKGTW